jgi:hypothetical protein
MAKTPAFFVRLRHDFAIGVKILFQISTFVPIVHLLITENIFGQTLDTALLSEYQSLAMQIWLSKSFCLLLMFHVG